MTITLSDLFSSPAHLLHSFAGEAAVFVPMDLEAYRRSMFLDDRISPAGGGSLRVPIDALLGERCPPRAAGWIFHMAHCGSTLLARALEAMGGDPVLREPLALRQVAVADAGALLPLALSMAGKTWPGGGPAIVKANVPVNFVLADIAALDPPSGAIMLWHDWRHHVVAALRSEARRGWLRRVCEELGDRLGDVDGTEDAERAAALWAAQIARFAAALPLMPQARTLDAADFYRAPGVTLAAAAGVLGLSCDQQRAVQVADSPLFRTYSKAPGEPFDDASRNARFAADCAMLAAELDRAERWLARRAPTLGDDLRTIAAAALVPADTMRDASPG